MLTGFSNSYIDACEPLTSTAGRYPMKPSQSGVILTTYHQRTSYLAFANTRHTGKVLTIWLLIARRSLPYVQATVEPFREEIGAAQLRELSSAAPLFCSERESYSAGLFAFGPLIAIQAYSSA